MGMVVRTNTMALNAYRQLGMNNSAVAKSLEKLSSGFRINRAGDDAAGLAISEKMKAQITGLETASANAQDGISLIQTAEGNLTEVHSMLNRMVELATKSANGTYQNEVDREAITAEVEALNEEIDRIAQSANFNGINLLDGTTGLNQKAFTIGDSSAKKAGASIPLAAGTNYPAEVTNPNAATQYHLTETGVSQSAPEFVADFADFAKTFATGDTISIQIAGKTISWAAAGAVSTAEDLVSDFMATVTTGGVTGVALNTAADADTSGAAAGYQLQVGGLNFDIESANDEAGNAVRLKFTYSHKGYDATSGNMDATYTSTDAANFNAAVANSVAAGTGDSGLVDHAVTLITKAEAEVKSQRAGTIFTLTSDIVADGNKLTIDDKTFVFKTNADSAVSAGSGEILIDVSAAATADQIKEAVLKLASTDNAEAPTNFQIGAAGANAIHVDQKIGSDKKYEDYDTLMGIFSAKKADTAASTQLTVNTNELKNGNAVNIGGKTFTFVTGNADASKNEIAIGANALADFEKALTKNGFSVVTNGSTFTISSTAKPDESPVVSGAGLILQIGDTGSSYNKMTVNIGDMGVDALKLNTVDVSNADAARASIDTIKAAINTVSSARADMGALQNRLEHTINNLDVAAENLSAANSRIRDTDMAKEMMNYTKMNVLVQSAQAMLAQANQQPQSVLQLLQ